VTYDLRNRVSSDHGNSVGCANEEGISNFIKHRSMKRTDWFIKDLIDLEYFLQRDENSQDESPQTSLAERDRHIYLNKILGKCPTFIDTEGATVFKGFPVWTKENPLLRGLSVGESAKSLDIIAFPVVGTKGFEPLTPTVSARLTSRYYCFYCFTLLCFLACC